MENTQKQPFFPLLGLPTELRLRIYEVLLYRNYPIVLSKNDYHLHSFRADDRRHWSPMELAAYKAHRERLEETVSNQARRNLNPTILRVSKRVYDEALSVLYSQNRFMLAHCQCMFDYRGCECPTRLLRRLPQNCKSLIRRIEMCHPNICGREYGSSSRERAAEIEGCFIRGLRYCWNLQTLTIHMFDPTELLGVLRELQATYAKAGRPAVAVMLRQDGRYEAFDQEVLDWISYYFCADAINIINTAYGAEHSLSRQLSGPSFYAGTEWLPKKTRLALTGPVTERVRDALDSLPYPTSSSSQTDKVDGRRTTSWNLEVRPL